MTAVCHRSSTRSMTCFLVSAIRKNSRRAGVGPVRLALLDVVEVPRGVGRIAGRVAQQAIDRQAHGKRGHVRLGVVVLWWWWGRWAHIARCCRRDRGSRRSCPTCSCRACADRSGSNTWRRRPACSGRRRRSGSCLRTWVGACRGRPCFRPWSCCRVRMGRSWSQRREGPTVVGSVPVAVAGQKGEVLLAGVLHRVAQFFGVARAAGEELAGE